MLPSQTLFSKASRLPLTSKRANKNFYKGTGSMPGLQKRTGRHSPQSKAPYIMMRERMRTFVVPESLDDSKLTPYVSKSVKLNALDWPVALSKPSSRNSQSVYTEKGFDGEYYLQLIRHHRQQ